MPPLLLELSLLSRHYLLSLEDFPSKEAVPFSPPKATLRDKTFDPESFLPAYPLELQHQDFSSLGLIFPVTDLTEPTVVQRWEALTNLMKKEKLTQAEAEQKLTETWWQEITLLRGSVTTSIRVQVNHATPTCSVCKRPLGLFLLHVGNLCPQDYLLRQLEEQAQAQLHLFPNFTESMKYQAADLLSSWRHRDYQWWDGEKSSLSPIYCAWRDREVSKLL